MSPARIYLVGMPGSGKSFFGRELAALSGYPLMDLDQAIEAHENREITEIFSTENEDYFRKVESELLHTLTETNSRMILSTGGGSPCFHDGMAYMKAHGVTVFLETPKETLIERLASEGHRPLIQDDVEARVDQLLSQRLSVYRQAHITITHRDPQKLISDLEGFFKN